MKILSNEYLSSLNSADKHDPELPLIKSKAHGGTMVLWKQKFDPFITVFPVSTTAFLPIIFHPPGLTPSIHFAVYLPTLGQERQFLEELSKLSITIDQMSSAHPDATIFLRGDFNVSQSNVKRSDLLKHFCNDHNLLELFIPHPTYHHFVGNGLSDSFLERILFSRSLAQHEILLNIHCKQTEPLIASHHDLLVSSWSIPHVAIQEVPTNNTVAPMIENKRVRVVWSDEGVEEYQKLVAPHISRIQELWLSTLSRTSVSLLLQSTNNIFTSFASHTNKTFPLDGSCKPRSHSTQRTVRLSQNALKKQNKHLRKATEECVNNNTDINSLKEEYNKSRIQHRKLEREFKARASYKRDQNLSRGPSFVFNSIRSAKRCKAGKIHKLTVGKKTYSGESVKDGFFDSILQLKTRDSDHLHSSDTFKEFSYDYNNILEVCRSGAQIPLISETESFKLMQKMKPDVNDFYGVTVNHYNYAGPSGWKHFNLLLNCLISDVNTTNIEEINTVYAIILFKGHNKEKTSDRSYRTISTCPVVAKALDIYIKDLNAQSWKENQADTQFQGEGSSHELAAVLLTETIQHSLYTLKQPVYILYLDAQSAFDLVLRELLIRKLYNCNTNGSSLLYINNRLGSRKTFIDWDGQLMGPIIDEQGLEQGGVSSTEFYKIFGKEQLTLAQDSLLGVPLGNLSVSAVGQADDTFLISNNIKNLQYLLHLSEAFCSRYQVKLCPEKTKLQVFSTKSME